MPRALVLDQSTRVSGYTAVDTDDPKVIYPGITGRILGHGIVVPGQSKDLSDRLLVIKADLTTLFEKFRIEELVLENTNFPQQSADLQNAFGALWVVCQKVARDHGVPLYHQNPGSIKKDVAGSGKADKRQVTEAVCRILNLSPASIKDDNHGDSLAGAIRWLMKCKEVRAAKGKKGNG